MQNPLKGMMDTSDAGTLGTALAEKQKIIEQDKSAQAAKPDTTPAKTTMASPKDKINPKAGYGSGKGEKRIDTSDMVKPIGSFHKGGTVPMDGPYNLKKGEHVMTAQQHGNMNHAFDLAGSVLAQQSPEPDMPKKELKEMRIRKGANGGHIVTHIHTHMMHPDEEHVHEHTDGLIDHVMQHMTEPNEGEAEADAGDPGIEAAEKAVGYK
jgi:hypothetical protein